ncbi:MAG: gamma carbonic anhydrase family protein [Bacteroidetes bacterium RIFCSPLOWO2_12_FULL_31_6]|nr:MAG: gamma carbonic anhydrase family protein [Bacteroidetes bacterium RIFCSPLOWO2_12_FULL_31_6]
MAIYEFNGFKPVIHKTAFIHPQAAVIGNVIIGKDVYVGPGATIRGDWGKISIEDGCNIQENCIIHLFTGATVILREGAHIGHGAIIHGGTIGKNCLIGMNSVVMDEVIMGDECIVGAISLVPAKMKIPKRSLLVGNPAKIIKKVTDEMMAWKTKGTQLYQTLPKQCHETLKECEPLRKEEANRPSQDSLYETWKNFKK